jgi:hypothetical protein
MGHQDYGKLSASRHGQKGWVIPKAQPLVIDGVGIEKLFYVTGASLNLRGIAMGGFEPYQVFCQVDGFFHLNELQIVKKMR